MDHLKFIASPPIFLEIGLGREFDKFRLEIPEPCPIIGHTTPIFVCISEEQFVDAIEKGDIGGPLQDERIFWFIGKTRFEELSKFLQKRSWIAPNLTVYSKNPNNPDNEQLKKVKSSLRKIEWNGTIRAEKKVAVIVPTRSTVLGYAMKNIAKSLIKQGENVEIISEPSRMDIMTSEYVKFRCNEIKPTHILNIYAPLTFEHPGAICNTWCQDPVIGFEGDIPDSDTVSFIMGGDITKQYGDQNFNKIILPIACNPDDFPLLEKLPTQFDISFVSHCDTNPQFEGLVKIGIDHFIKHGTLSTTSFNYMKAFDIIKRIKGILLKDRKRIARIYMMEVERISFRLYWISIIISVVKKNNLRLGLFGSGWEKFNFTKEYAKGQLKGPKAVSDVFRSSTNNIHMNPHTNMHQRVLEAGLSGTPIVFPKIAHDDNEKEGGILSYFKDWMLNRFDERNSEHCLLQKWDYDPTPLVFRREILASHTYDTRARQMLDAIS